MIQFTLIVPHVFKMKCEAENTFKGHSGYRRIVQLVFSDKLKRLLTCVLLIPKKKMVTQHERRHYMNPHVCS